MSRLKAALEAANIVVRKFDKEKTRSVTTSEKSMTIGNFAKELQSKLGRSLKTFGDVVDGIQDHTVMAELLEEYIEEEGLADNSGGGMMVAPEVSHLTLNIDMSSSDSGLKKFFCTTADEIVDPSISGQYFLGKSGISVQDGFHVARPVVPKYMPRKGPGVHPMLDKATNQTVNYFNTHIPPEWERWRRKNPKAWAKLPAKPPGDIIKMLKHVLPLKKEREYFYAWVYTSIRSRSLVYLSLCGKPGLGKNRIKLLLRALHGEHNSVDGKKETFGANQSKFNSQMAESTLNWLDELKVTQEMEPRMKEYQNPFISIERKGVDATRSTEIFCSMVISNNELRDNYLPFNARKFAPLVTGLTDLKTTMTDKEITEMSEKLGEIPGRMNVKYVAQIAKWILTVGPKHVGKFRHMEYKGPMFWEMAHASMSHWQKSLILYLTTQTSRGPIAGWDESKKAFQWSKAEEALRRKKEFDIKSIHMATIQPFLENYCDRSGKKVFEVEPILDGVMDDFWVRPIGGLERLSVKPRERKEETSDKGGPVRPVRPPGMSGFKWRKMLAEWEATHGKALKDVIDEEN